jgi:hypothetical protein
MADIRFWLEEAEALREANDELLRISQRVPEHSPVRTLLERLADLVEGLAASSTLIEPPQEDSDG